jgi:hypothetical protein
MKSFVEQIREWESLVQKFEEIEDEARKRWGKEEEELYMVKRLLWDAKPKHSDFIGGVTK